MGRIRTIKPELAKHEELFELEQKTGLPIRFAWAVLPTACDREGRFKWRPNAMKSDLLPFDTCDFDDVLEALLGAGQLVKYRVGSTWFGWVPTFSTHQRVSPREEASLLPALTSAEEVLDRRPVRGAEDTLRGSLEIRGNPVQGSVEARAEASKPLDRPMGGIGMREGKGREGKGKEYFTFGEVCAEPQSDSTPSESATALEFPVTGADGRVWKLSERQLEEWQTLFDTVDVLREAKQALAWVQANPGRRKTGRGMPKFLVSWFSRSADRGGGGGRVHSRREDTERWVCSHVQRCHNRAQCEQATILGRPTKKAVAS